MKEKHNKKDQKIDKNLNFENFITDGRLSTISTFFSTPKDNSEKDIKLMFYAYIENRNITAIEFALENTCILIGLENGIIKLINILLQATIHVFNDSPGECITSLKCPSNGKWVISANSSGGVKKFAFKAKVSKMLTLPNKEQFMENEDNISNNQFMYGNKGHKNTLFNIDLYKNQHNKSCKSLLSDDEIVIDMNDKIICQCFNTELIFYDIKEGKKIFKRSAQGTWASGLLSHG